MELPEEIEQKIAEYDRQNAIASQVRQLQAAAVDLSAFVNNKGEAAEPVDPKLLARQRRQRARNLQKAKDVAERRRREKQANASRRRNRQ